MAEEGMTSEDSLGNRQDEHLAARVDQALRYDFEEVDGPRAHSAGLHEEFDFFVMSGESPRRGREPTLEDCRNLYRKLRDEADKLRRDRADFDMQAALFERGRAAANSEIDWQAKFIRLKQKYAALKLKCTGPLSPEISDPDLATGFPTPIKSSTKRKKAKHKKSPARVHHPTSISPKRPIPTKVKPVSTETRPPQSSPKLFSRHYPLSPKYALDFSFDPGPIVRRSNFSRCTDQATVRYANGSSGFIFRNGARSVRNGTQTYTFYDNGDIAIAFDDGARAYRYVASDTTELDLPDGTKLFVFADGQRERHLPDGRKEILRPDGKLFTP
jgi:hypothetical protein